MSNIIAFHGAEAISFGAFHALGHEDYSISFGLQLSCYYLYLKATGNLEMKKNRIQFFKLIFKHSYIVQCLSHSHTCYHRNCNLKMWNKFYLPTSCTLTVHIFWFRPLKRCIRIHYRSASIRKSQENLWIIIYLGLPCAFQDWFWHNYRQYILESQLNCYFEYFASKGQQAKCKSRRAFSFKAIVGNIRFPAAENFSYHCAGYKRALPTMPFYKHTRLKCV